MIHNSDSKVQKDIELKILKSLGLEPYKYEKEINGKKVKFEFDGINKEKDTLYEIYASTGKLSQGKKRKLSNDILKFLTFEKLTGKHLEKKLIVVDEEIEKQLTFESSQTWRNKGIEIFGIKVELFENLTDTEIKELKEAQKRQAKGISEKKKS